MDPQRPPSRRRLNIPTWAMRIGVNRGHQTQRRLAIARVTEGLEAAVAPFADRVPIEQLREALLPLLQAADLKGYRRGCRTRQRHDRKDRRP